MKKKEIQKQLILGESACQVVSIEIEKWLVGELSEIDEKFNVDISTSFGYIFEPFIESNIGLLNYGFFKLCLLFDSTRGCKIRIKGNDFSLVNLLECYVTPICFTNKFLKGKRYEEFKEMVYGYVSRLCKFVSRLKRLVKNESA